MLSFGLLSVSASFLVGLACARVGDVGQKFWLSFSWEYRWCGIVIGWVVRWVEVEEVAGVVLVYLRLFGVLSIYSVRYLWVIGVEIYIYIYSHMDNKDAKLAGQPRGSFVQPSVLNWFGYAIPTEGPLHV